MCFCLYREPLLSMMGAGPKPEDKVVTDALPDILSPMGKD